MYTMLVYLLLAVFVSVNFVPVQAANILGLFPCPSKSHTLLARALMKELAKRGHNVTLFSPFVYEDPPANFTNVPIEGAIEEYRKGQASIMNLQSSTIFKYLIAFKNTMEIGKFIMHREEFQRLVYQESKFDLIIQQWILSDAMLIMGHKHNAPTIVFATHGLDVTSGVLFNNPMPYAYVPNTFISFTDDMSLVQRVINTITCIGIHIITVAWNIPYNRALLSKLYPDAPPLEELINNVDIMLVNSHVLSETPRPFLPNVIQIGGFHLYDTEVLTGDVKKFLDESTEGVIYCNFGTNVNNLTLSEGIQNEIKNSLSKIKYKLLYKFDGEWLDKPKHIFTSKWLPQRAILAHRNVKVFITHGGLGGIVEGLFYGVPMLGMPFCLDQAKNIANIVQKGCGIEINPTTFTEEGFARYIEEIINNPEYARNAKAVSELYQHKEVNPMEKAMYWVEHILKYKNAKYLKSKGCSMPWYKYMLVDVFAVIALIFGIVLLMVILIIKRLHYVFRNLFVITKKKTM